MNNDTTIVAAFRTQLQVLGKDFVCNTPLPASEASVYFLGEFHGDTVLWNMTLSTLDYLRSLAFGGHAPLQTDLYQRPFIEITACHEGVCQLAASLDLAAIDETVIKKSIIMIRNDRRLTLGKIEFGGNTT